MYDKTRFLGGTGVSILVVALVGLLVLSSGTAYAAAIATAGGSGFTVEADEIRSEEFMLYPNHGEDDEGATPVVVVEQRGVEIDGLVLTREQEVPGIDGAMEISFTTDETVTADEQYIKLTGLDAENAEFDGQVIETQASDDPQQEFQQTAGENADPEEGLLTDIEGEGPGMVQEDVEIEMVYLASNEITLPGLEVDANYESGGDEPDGNESGEPDGDEDEIAENESAGGE